MVQRRQVATLHSCTSLYAHYIHYILYDLGPCAQRQRNASSLRSPASFHLPIHLGTPSEGGTRSYEGRREARQGRHGRRRRVQGEGGGERGGTREERRIRGANRRRNRPFHLYAARIQLTLHLLPSFFFSSRGPAFLCALPYTGCSSARARITVTLVKNVHCTTPDTPFVSSPSVPVTFLTKLLRVFDLKRWTPQMFVERTREFSGNWFTWNVSNVSDISDVRDFFRDYR